MPLYKYRCVKCGHVMEILERAGVPGEHVCGKCGGQVEKLMSAFSVGSGSSSSAGSCPTGTCPLS